MCADSILGLIKKCLGKEKKYLATHDLNIAKKVPSSPPGRLSSHCGRQQQHRKQQGVLCSNNTSPGGVCSNSSKCSNKRRVMYVPPIPSTPPSRFEREIAMQRERQIRYQSVQMDMDMELPPSIPISEDGEEGYVTSRRLLQISACNPSKELERECFRPPPNKTIFDGESPPPYRSHSAGLLEWQQRRKAPSTSSSSSSSMVGRLVRDCNSTPTVVRCNSLSCQMHSNLRDRELVQRPCSCTSASAGGGGGEHSRHTSGSSSGSRNDLPPEYSEVIANLEAYSDSSLTNDSSLTSSSGAPLTSNGGTTRSNL